MKQMNANRKIILFCVVAIVAIGVLLFYKKDPPEGGNESGKPAAGQESPEADEKGAILSAPSGAAVSGQAIGADDIPEGEKKNGEKESDQPEDTKVPADGRDVPAAQKDSPGDGKDEKGDDLSKASTSGKRVQKGKASAGGDKADAERKKTSAKGSKTSVEREREPEQEEKASSGGGADPQTASDEKLPLTVSGTPSPEQGTECSMKITCAELLSHLGELKESVKKVIPKDGVFLEGNFAFTEGETVFNVLKKACGEKKILLDYVFTPIYSSYYIKGIGNLYEFDCGDGSGWMYQVNGSEPGYGCSQYKLKNGDEVVFYYTCGE